MKTGKVALWYLAQWRNRDLGHGIGERYTILDVDCLQHSPHDFLVGFLYNLEYSVSVRSTGYCTFTYCHCNHLTHPCCSQRSANPSCLNCEAGDFTYPTRQEGRAGQVGTAPDL